MTDCGYIVVYQCKRCNTILGDSSSSIDDMTPLSLNRLSTNVSFKSFQVFCTGCKECVATKYNDCIYRLESSKICSTPIGNFSQLMKRMEDQLKEQNIKIAQLNSRIVELGVQAITNRLDLITHKFAIEHNNPGFYIDQFKKELESL